MPVIARFSTTPVKGLALHHPRRLALTRNGADDNRRFYLVDARHRLFNGKRHGPLVRVTAQYDGQRRHLSLQIPGRAPVQGATTELGEPVVTNFYGRREVAGHLVTGPWSAALSEFVDEPVHLVVSVTPGDAVDAYAVTLISSATIEHLRSVTPGGDLLDHRRFRMLVEVDGCAVNEEDSWVGRRVRLGEAAVRVVGPVPRCVVVNENPDSGVVDFSTLKAVARYRRELATDPTGPVPHVADNVGVVFGMYATVEQPGSLHIGDPVELLWAEASVDH